MQAESDYSRSATPEKQRSENKERIAAQEFAGFELRGAANLDRI
jgi:hypothetical protein